ncbi:hypothetical protein BD311DRAFT_755524 [Dichomitus squalens]|uniref:Uncharacterized protein n=1 Tax=Dichomitus squalens TaxID=114155 RepID=A0A4Q9MQG4_9APHY|nr:hypothetical protein BD311DRAFT_755524 [Dichomitus squalens]
MPNSEDEEPPAEIDPAYLAFFSESVDDFRAHLIGRTGDDPLPPSYFAPRAYWTSAEKDAFFRGLVVHSRLRPDLIAEEVKTKTVPDVCVYLSILELAEQELSGGTTYVNEYHRVPDIKTPRDELPSALEVSEEWIAFEERMADAMIAYQPTLDQEAVVQEREEEVHARKTTIRAPWRGGRTASAERDRVGEKARREQFERWLAQKKSEWEREDMLSSLNRVGLATLDRMLRDEEEGRGVVGEASEYNSEVEPSPVPEILDMPEQVPGQPSVGELAVGIHDQLIDPALLEISRPKPTYTSNPTPEYGSVQNISPAVQPSSVIALPMLISHPVSQSTPPALLASLPASPQFSLNTTPTTVAPSVGTTEDSIEDPSQMSPRARRRYQKRLYMRRKRAQATGGVLVEAAERLKPGRKPKKTLSSAPSTEDLRAQAVTSTASGLSAPGDTIQLSSPPAPPGVPVGARYASTSRKTQPDKRQLEFISSGVDVRWLRQEGLDLFHLQAISKLMRTYNELHDVPESVVSSISGETLRMLRSLVVHFVAEVMSRAIVWREQERVAKLQTKAWRLRENQVISTADVRQALMLYGAESLNKRTHFASLLSELDLDSDEEEGDVEELEQDTADALSPVSRRHKGGADAAEEESDDPDPEGLPLEPLSLLGTIFPPFLNPPSSGPPSVDPSMAIDPSVYMPWPSSSVLLTDVERPTDDDLLPHFIDEKLLNEELHEEAQLDKADALRDAEEEQALWTRVNMENPNAGKAASAATVPEDPLIAVADNTANLVPIRERSRRKRKRDEADAGADLTSNAKPDVEVSWEKDADSGRADERDVEEMVEEVAAVDTMADVDEPEVVAPKRARKGRKGEGKKKGDLSQRELMYMQPGVNSRIKSSVYVLDSD